MLTKRTVTAPAAKRSTITAGTNITAGVKNRNTAGLGKNTRMLDLTPAQRVFANQILRNYQRTSITAATNTSNIAARPDFLELLPMFVQKLLLLDVFGSVAMRSRQQLIPYFKFVAENTKGQTKAGDILSSPFVNRQGIDPNFTGRVVKNEILTEGPIADVNPMIVYTPVLPGSVTLYAKTAAGVVTPITDNAAGDLYKTDDSTTAVGYIDYSTGEVVLDGVTIEEGGSLTATYQYDNETVGPHMDSPRDHGQYGAAMAKGYLQLDEINMVAEARQLACYWSIYSAFAAQQEYGGNIGDIAKEAAFSELTAELNSWGFEELAKAAAYNPSFNWDAAPVLNGSVVPSDYLNMFKLKLNQAAAAIYQSTRLSRPNRLIVGSNVAAYISMIDSFRADSVEESVGPYHLGTMDQFEIYVAPDYDPNKWVMACKSNDIRRNSALFGEYMPFVSTDAIGLANSSVQQGYATMCGLKVVNGASLVSGKIVGTF